ncbi:O-antigen translocase [Legionella sp. km772]|uniref:O-antigen translocase n=1 Tax=Legionella sp. km772 TaxID=2498111 RepID=UPI000F8E70D8|nr:O-antigen translocase [Legionella sp. km772]RUR12122.1 O-antigen translocase [Legionella sp. km772]
MSLIKTSILNSIAVIIKLLTFLGINKLLSLYVGPIGYAFLGQYQNLITVMSTFASGAITTGVTKYTAEYYYDEKKQHVLWRTAAKISFIGSLATAILISLFSSSLASIFLHDERLGGVFLWFAATLILFVLNSLLLALLNGKKEIAIYVLANIAGSFLALLITAVLVIYYGLYGALVALAIYQSISFFVTFFLCYKTSWFKLAYLVGPIDKPMATNLFRYALMAIVSAICIPGSQILVRNYIGSMINWQAAGYLEAMWRLSAAYLMVVTTTLSVYFIPRISELNDASKIKVEVLKTFKVILPFTIVCSVGIYLLRKFLINLLFTADFNHMEELFAWQMIGDTIKVSSWILMYLYVAKNFYRLYIFSEIFFSISFYLLVIVLESKFKLQSVAIAHAINYCFYFSFGLCALKLKRVL